MFVERMDMITKGEIPLVLLSPESLFSGSWRELVMSNIYQENVKTIVVDECHCVEEWLVLYLSFMNNFSFLLLK
jgi:superfamily II DNA helicase RecQ